jgi:hypothetical protein
MLAFMARPPRARRQRREDDRLRRKTVARLQQVATELPGGAADRPIDVTSASLVELKARATPCLQCAGELEIRGEAASSTTRGVLRQVELACRRCHAPRTLWLRIGVPGGN